MHQIEAAATYFYGPYPEMSTQLDLSTNGQIEKKLNSAATSSPNLDTVTSSPDLQWLLESSLVSEPESTWESLASFLPSTLPNCPCVSQAFNPALLHSGTEERSKDRDNENSAEECERRRARRERNRIAAARCRDRRRILTDTLQNETEHLEQVKSQLEEEIADLEREKERLELILEAHRPVCKMDCANRDNH